MRVQKRQINDDVTYFSILVCLHNKIIERSRSTEPLNISYIISYVYSSVGRG